MPPIQVEKNLAISPIPRREDIGSLREFFDSLLLLVMDFEVPYPLEELTDGFNVLHVPIPDFSAPSLEELIAILRWIEGEVQSGRRVLVVCAGGCGRSGTIAVAWLMFSRGLTLREALARVRRKRHCAVETAEQLNLLKSLEIYLKKTKKHRE